jgi:DNA-binding beta-propeller fold protein YncE
MGLRLFRVIKLPEHTRPGGFDRAAIHHASGRLFVAHTVNNAVDVIDCVADQYVYSIQSLPGVAGALVSDERNLVFTSNRGENTVGIFHPNNGTVVIRVPVGIRPNGLAFDPLRGNLLVANAGDPEVPDSFTLSLVDVVSHKMLASIPVPGRTRWVVFDREERAFYVNIADPAQIVVVEACSPFHITRTIPIPAAGPHGLELDAENHRLFCACDARKLITLDPRTGEVLSTLELSGAPDVVCYNPSLSRLYVAIGDTGVIDVFDTNGLYRLATIPAERGAHTIALDMERKKLYAFLPTSNRAFVYQEIA